MGQGGVQGRGGGRQGAAASVQVHAVLAVGRASRATEVDDQGRAGGGHGVDAQELPQGGRDVHVDGLRGAAGRGAPQGAASVPGGPARGAAAAHGDARVRGRPAESGQHLLHEQRGAVHVRRGAAATGAQAVHAQCSKYGPHDGPRHQAGGLSKEPDAGE